MKRIAIILLNIAVFANCGRREETPAAAPTLVGKWTFSETKGSVDDVLSKTTRYDKKSNAGHFLDFKSDNTFTTNGDGVSCGVCVLGDDREGGTYTYNPTTSQIIFTSKNIPGKPDLVEIARVSLLTGNQLVIEYDKASFIASLKASQLPADAASMESLIRTMNITTHLTR